MCLPLCRPLLLSDVHQKRDAQPLNASVPRGSMLIHNLSVGQAQIKLIKTVRYASRSLLVLMENHPSTVNSYEYECDLQTCLLNI